LNFDRFVSAWRKARPHILVHPPGATRNIAYKGPGVLLVALYLGAAPIVADEPAFEGIGAANGVLRVGNLDAWRSALAELAEPTTRSTYLSRLVEHARRRWAPRQAQATIERLLTHAAPAGSAARARQSAARALGWDPRARLSWVGFTARQRLSRKFRL
jgi:hypothetical protein